MTSTWLQTPAHSLTPTRCVRASCTRGGRTHGGVLPARLTAALRSLTRTWPEGHEGNVYSCYQLKGKYPSAPRPIGLEGPQLQGGASGEEALRRLLHLHLLLGGDKQMSQALGPVPRLGCASQHQTQSLKTHCCRFTSQQRSEAS